MTTQKTRGLSPLASLCLGAIRGWLQVVRRGRGGELRNGVPYTRLKASELQAQLSSEYQVAVSAKTVQRALTQLVAGGHLSRRQLYVHRHNRTYWYAPGPLEQQAEAHRPRTVAARFQRGSTSGSQPVPTTKSTSPHRVDSPVPSVLNAQITYSPLKPDGSPTAQQPPTRETPCDQPGALQESVSKAWGIQRPTAQKPATGAHSGRLQQAQERLAQVVQTAAAFRGFGTRQQPQSAHKENQCLAAASVRLRAESATQAGFLR